MDLGAFGIEMVDVTPPENKARWIFKDSPFLPVVGAIYLGDGKYGDKSIDCRVFDAGAGSPLPLSKWNREVNIPLNLKKGDKVHISFEKDGKITVLKLTP